MCISTDREFLKHGHQTMMDSNPQRRETDVVQMS